MFVGKVLIGKRRAVDTKLAGAVAVDKIAALYHKVLNYSMKRRSLVSRRLLVELGGRVFARAELTEVLACFGALDVCYLEAIKGIYRKENLVCENR